MITVDEMVESGKCPCEVCSSQDDLPILPEDEELKKPPPHPKEQEEIMRTLARQAIKLFLERRKNNLQNPTKDNTVKEENG